MLEAEGNSIIFYFHVGNRTESKARNVVPNRTAVHQLGTAEPQSGGALHTAASYETRSGHAVPRSSGREPVPQAAEQTRQQ